MKSNFKSSLFNKKIELNSFDTINGGGTGCKITTYDTEDGTQHVTTTYYNENGQITQIDHCYQDIQ